MGATLAYACRVAPEIADDVAAVDAALVTGYNWRDGPFRLIDRLGAERFAGLMAADGREVPPLLAAAAEAGGFYRDADGVPACLTTRGVAAPLPRRAGRLALDDVRRAGPPLWRNGSASLWDIGDGATLVEFTSKMNTLDADSFACLKQAIRITGEGYRALVIGNEAEAFCAGANLGFGLFTANLAAWDRLDAAIREGQDTLAALRTAPFPVVAAPAGLALGGGCEILLHADAVQAHAETYAGLVELGVGIVPAWGGCTRLLLRHLARTGRPGGPMPAIAETFRTIALASVAKSAAEARDLLFLTGDDGITMNRDRVLADAKARALDMADGYRPPAPATDIHLPGPTGAAALALQVEGFRLTGQASPHDAVVAGALARVLTGGDADWTDALDERHLLDLERAAFNRLVRTEATLARMEHMLATGKPLRN
jgi:3-hydroxyacyl-CoA dehydrogenase